MIAVLVGAISVVSAPVSQTPEPWVRVSSLKNGYSILLPKRLAEQEHFDGPMLGRSSGTRRSSSAAAETPRWKRRTT